MRSAKERIKTLQRRLDWLRKRTADNPDLSHDRAEAAALDWAIRNLKPIAEREDMARCR